MKFGIVGCGEISSVHVNAILKTKKAEIVSACDLVKERAEKIAKQYDIPRVYTDFAEMLKKEKLDAVDVVTSPQTHAALAIEAMNAGFNVMVEKPMCMNVEQADAMIKAAKENNVKLGVIHSFLFTPPIQKALKKVKEGEIGKLLWVDTLVSINSLLKWQNAVGFPGWYRTLPGGLFGEIIPHGLYVQLAFLGKVKRVVGVTRSFENATDLVPFSEIQVNLEGENGLGGLCMTSRLESPYTIMMVRVVGSRKTLIVNVPAASVVSIDSSNSTSAFSRASMNIKPAFQYLGSTISSASKTVVGSTQHHMTHKILMDGFIESILTGSEPLVTAEDGKEVVRATNMIWKNILS
jgi:UDP-N-acetyl-2-amino-2-deoxyglucuronate dehydrogenase